MAGRVYTWTCAHRHRFQQGLLLCHAGAGGQQALHASLQLVKQHLQAAISGAGTGLATLQNPLAWQDSLGAVAAAAATAAALVVFVAATAVGSQPAIGTAQQAPTTRALWSAEMRSSILMRVAR